MFKFDPSEKGIETVLKPWQAAALEAVMEHPPANSRDAWLGTIKSGFDVSRASVINFLIEAEEAGIVTSVDVTGKGGHHPVYSMKPGLGTARDVKRFLADTLTKAISRELLGEES